MELIQPLGDIDVLNTEKKIHLGHDKEVLTLPTGYKVVSNPIFQSYLIYKRSKKYYILVKSRLEQTFKPIII